jgi:hypothetical protein
MINSTRDRSATGNGGMGWKAKWQKLSGLRRDEAIEEFGYRVAHSKTDAQTGKSSEGEQNGQENLEEGEEARSDETVDRDRSLVRKNG